jgi:hypothetical protein
MPGQQLDEQAIFQNARLIESRDARQKFVELLCANDEQLRQRVQQLLDDHDQNVRWAVPTETSAPPHLPIVELSKPSPRPASSDSARFNPGQLLAARYRIVSLLGKGGMGEVYRADDLKLGQSVALKFLPPLVSHQPERLDRFHNEVRIARQVSHPNVCRVYDIADAGGQVFLSMEYIDGEDLASLLKRIGRLPEEKGIELARQLCLGLAAAHDKGVLHRDSS